MGFGIEGTPFYIPDPRKPEEVVEAVYMHTGVVALGSVVYVYEVARLSRPVRPGVWRMAGHRTEGLGPAAIRRLAMKETTKFTVTGGLSLIPKAPIALGLLTYLGVTEQYQAMAYHGSGVRGSGTIGVSPSHHLVGGKPWWDS